MSKNHEMYVWALSKARDRLQVDMDTYKYFKNKCKKLEGLKKAGKEVDDMDIRVCKGACRSCLKRAKKYIKMIHNLERGLSL